MTKVKIKRLHPDAVIPRYAHGSGEDAGMDLVSVEHATIPPLGRRAIGTGLAVELPLGFELQIRPRSGLALNDGVGVANAPGTIDPSYRGEIKVILENRGLTHFAVTAGQRIAQAVLARYEQADMEVTEDELSETARGAGGFGSTGM